MVGRSKRFVFKKVVDEEEGKPARKKKRKKKRPKKMVVGGIFSRGRQEEKEKKSSISALTNDLDTEFFRKLLSGSGRFFLSWLSENPRTLDARDDGHHRQFSF